MACVPRRARWKDGLAPSPPTTQHGLHLVLVPHKQPAAAAAAHVPQPHCRSAGASRGKFWAQVPQSPSTRGRERSASAAQCHPPSQSTARALSHRMLFRRCNRAMELSPARASTPPVPPHLFGRWSLWQYSGSWGASEPHRRPRCALQGLREGWTSSAVSLPQAATT